MTITTTRPPEAATTSILVSGTPTPQGSKRIGRNRKTKRPILIDDNDVKLGVWRELVTLSARKAGLVAGPVEIHVTFYIARPIGHYRTGRYAHLLRDAAPAWPAVKPDVDKLERSTLDALTTAGAIEDDARVVDLIGRKRYADGGRQPGAVISILPM